VLADAKGRGVQTNSRVLFMLLLAASGVELARGQVAVLFAEVAELRARCPPDRRHACFQCQMLWSVSQRSCRLQCLPSCAYGHVVHVQAKGTCSSSQRDAAPVYHSCVHDIAYQQAACAAQRVQCAAEAVRGGRHPRARARGLEGGAAGAARWVPAPVCLLRRMSAAAAPGSAAALGSRKRCGRRLRRAAWSRKAHAAPLSSATRRRPPTAPRRAQDHPMPDSHMYVELFRCCAASPTPELLRAAAAAYVQIGARWDVARAADRCSAAYEECAPRARAAPARLCAPHT